MGEKVYIDLVFLANFLMDLVLLYISGQLLPCRRKWTAMLSAAAFGAACSCLLTVCGIRGAWPGILFHGGAALLMLRMGLGLKKSSLLFQAFLFLYGAAFLCGGAWEVLIRRDTLSIRVFLLFTGGTFLILRTWSRFWDSFHIRGKNTFPVVITHREKQIAACGFYDTGNLLMDPLTRSPVSVASPELLGQLLAAGTTERLKKLMEKPGEMKNTELLELKPRLLPFRTVGKSEGVIVAVTLDELCIQAPGEDVHISHPVFALSAEPFTYASEYNVILNAKIFDQEGKV